MPRLAQKPSFFAYFTTPPEKPARTGFTKNLERISDFSTRLPACGGSSEGDRLLWGRLIPADAPKVAKDGRTRRGAFGRSAD